MRVYFDTCAKNVVEYFFHAYQTIRKDQKLSEKEKGGKKSNNTIKNSSNMNIQTLR